MTDYSSAPNKPATFVATIDPALAPKLKADLAAQGFSFTVPPYTIFSGQKKGVSCTLYQSGKLTVQGKDKDEFIEFYLEPQILMATPYTYENTSMDTSPHIGIDESGKGDFFGPLCVAGVFAKGDEIIRLKRMGVCDSKKLTDAKAESLAKQIRAEFVHHIIRINPLKYNELYQQFANLNRLLAWGHATTIENLVLRTQCSDVTIDQFADEHVVLTALRRKKLTVNLTQRHRAEEDLVVAAASILARHAFLEGLAKLGEQFGIKLPKGASSQTIKAGNTFVERLGREELKHVAKLHFKTLDSIRMD
jgi:ribonuclease HIII